MAGAWYVGRASWRQRWRQLLFLVLIAGFVGGAVLGAAAGARRTSSAYDRLLRTSRSPHEVLFVTGGHVAEIERFLGTAPSVDYYARGIGMIGRQSPGQDWYSLDAPIDRALISSNKFERGRRPRLDRADEVIITLRTAQNTGLDIGDRVEFRAYDRSQAGEVIANPWTKPTGEKISVRVVGIARDPTDAQLSQTIKLLFGTPAFARQHVKTAAVDGDRGLAQGRDRRTRRRTSVSSPSSRAASVPTFPSPRCRRAPTPSPPTRRLERSWSGSRSSRWSAGWPGSSRSRRRCGATSPAPPTKHASSPRSAPAGSIGRRYSSSPRSPSCWRRRSWPWPSRTRCRRHFPSARPATWSPIPGCAPIGSSSSPADWRARRDHRRHDGSCLAGLDPQGAARTHPDPRQRLGRGPGLPPRRDRRSFRAPARWPPARIATSGPRGRGGRRGRPRRECDVRRVVERVHEHRRALRRELRSLDGVAERRRQGRVRPSGCRSGARRGGRGTQRGSSRSEGAASTRSASSRPRGR